MVVIDVSMVKSGEQFDQSSRIRFEYLPIQL